MFKILVITLALLLGFTNSANSSISRDWREISVSSFDDAGKEGSWNKGYEVVFSFPNGLGKMIYILVCQPDNFSQKSATLYYEINGQPSFDEVNIDFQNPHPKSDDTAYRFWKYYCK